LIEIKAILKIKSMGGILFLKALKKKKRCPLTKKNERSLSMGRFIPKSAKKGLRIIGYKGPWNEG
jgi:hypothetical protein